MVLLSVSCPMFLLLARFCCLQLDSMVCFTDFKICAALVDFDFDTMVAA
jgi:hypothetical protein